jgi:hypothetical protein
MIAGLCILLAGTVAQTRKWKPITRQKRVLEKLLGDLRLALESGWAWVAVTTARRMQLRMIGTADFLSPNPGSTDDEAFLQKFVKLGMKNGF